METTWPSLWREEASKDYFKKLQNFVAQQRKMGLVFPPEDEVFAALQFTPLEKVRVLILGQDPYHDHHQAHGLCFSVRKGLPLPPSLLNIFKELNSDLGYPIPQQGDLTAWAQQGVLLLNTVLTVQAHQANSHQNQGWEIFTDAVLRAVNAKPTPTVFILWGAHARRKAELINRQRHLILQAPHPSPLSAHRGFFGSRPFSQTNAFLQAHGFPEINWSR